MHGLVYGQCRAGAQIIFHESGRGLGHVTSTIFGSTVGYPSDSLASCFLGFNVRGPDTRFSRQLWEQCR